MFSLAVKGLKNDDDGASERTVECPHCQAVYKFVTGDLVWDSDGKFEFTDVECECGRNFQICGIYRNRRYEFFAGY